MYRRRRGPPVIVNTRRRGFGSSLVPLAAGVGVGMLASQPRHVAPPPPPPQQTTVYHNVAQPGTQQCVFDPTTGQYVPVVNAPPYGAPTTTTTTTYHTPHPGYY